MNSLHSFCRLLAKGTAVATCLVATAIAQDDNLVGTWDCGLSFTDPSIGAVITADFNMTYDRNGSYDRNGEMNISIPAFEVEISIALDEAGTWRMVSPMVVGETPSRLEFTNNDSSPSDMENMMFQQMQAEASTSLSQEETTEIASLTATTMELASDDGGPLTCQKA